MRAFFIIFLVSFPLIVSSYTINRGTYGEELYWESPSQGVVVNTSNSSLISSATVLSEVSSAGTQLGAQGFAISASSTTGGAQANRNDIYFTSDTSVFGGGTSILGITKVSFEQSSGKIVEADILINDGVFFSSTAGTANFVGDVIAHEMGHLTGLGHSQVLGATMFYSLATGQNTFDDDDKSALTHLYGTSSSKITGTVVGGDFVGIFGAHVQAIASSSGEVIASTVSESDGSFIISGLSKNETYYLYVEPLKNLSNMPSHFNSARSNFCLSEATYRGKFFQSCRGSEEGRPMGISTGSSSSVSAGYVSIGCDLSVPPDYIIDKSASVAHTIDIVKNGNAGDAIVGYFSETQATLSSADEFEIDLRDFTVPTGDHYLDIKLVYQSMYSPLRLTLSSMTETIEFETVADGNGLYYDSDNNPDLDVTGRIKLDSTSSNNLFKFKVTPEKLSNFVAPIPLMTVDTFLPSSDDYIDDMNFYMMILTVSKKELGVYTVVSEKAHSFQDNRNCLDAPRSYSVSETSQTKSEALQELEKRKNQKDPSIVSCGSIGSGGGPGSGPLTFTLAFLMGLFLSLIPSIKNKRS